MKEPIKPENEELRQKEVEKYQLLDTPAEEKYDTITAILANICEVPIAFVAILDKERNFLKSHHGINLQEDPRNRSFCAHTICEIEDFMVVQDASKDKRFYDNPLVTEMGVRFYAGASLINPEGFKLGTLCIFDTKPKELNDFQLKTLLGLSKQVMQIMENHYNSIALREAKAKLEQRNFELDKLNTLLETKVAERTVELQKSLSEKEVLLKEVHHRVKNNLQILRSMLNLYGMQYENHYVKTFIGEYKRNLDAIALVHENLYQESDFTEIDFTNYANELTNYFSKSTGVMVKAEVKNTSEKVYLSVNKAITLALILNKFLAKVNRQANLQQGIKTVEVLLEKKKKEILLAFEVMNQNHEYTAEESNSFELEIVSLLIKQLNGRFETSNSGEKYRLEFEA